MENMVKENLDLKIKFLTEFQTFENSLNGQASDSIHKIRQDAIEVFNDLGFPVKKNEEWKYTSLNPALKFDYRSTVIEDVTSIDQSQIEQYLIEGFNANLIVLVNGKFDNALSKIISDQEKIFIGSFLEGKEKFGKEFKDHFAKYADYRSDGMTALNTAFAKDGLFIYVKKGAIVEDAIHVINLSTGINESPVSQPRNLFIAEEGSSVTIYEDFRTTGDNPCFTNVVTEIYIGRNSRVEHYKIQNDGENSFHVNTTQVNQERESYYNNVTISWGGSIIRNNLNAVFNDENTECHFYGLYLLTGKQHVDNHTLADHKMPNCFSNELYKGIIADKATGVFNGKIMVREDAQKTNAYQSNNTILLSDDATINAKPQLEIFADDVKCSHGATTGQLNKDEMFYLRSRGISEEDSKKLLLYAFSSDIIEPVKNEILKGYLFKMLEEKLKKV